MADARRVIELVFGAVDQTSQVVDHMSSSLDTFAGKVSNITQPVATLTTNLLAFEAAVGASALAVGAFATTQAAQFDSQIREIVTLVNGNTAEVQALGKEILALGPNSAFSFDTLTNSVYKAVSATGDLGAGVQVVQQAEKLAIAGRAELNDTTLLLVSTLNAYGLGMDQAARVSDIFFAAVQGGQTTVSELASSMGQVAPTAAAAGVSIDELAAAVSFLTKNGLGTSEAVTGLKAALSNVVQPTKEAEETAKALGIQFDANALASKGLAGFIAELAQATGGSITEMGKFFGSVEGLNAVMVLAQGSAQGFAAQVDAIGNSSGSTQRAYELMVDTVTVQTQRMLNAIQAAAITIGLQLQEPVAEVEAAIANVFAAIQQAASSGAFDPLIDALTSGLNTIAGVLNEIAENLPAALATLDYSAFIASLEELAATIGLVFEGVDISTPEGLAAALQSVVNVGTTLINVTTGLAESAVPVIRQFIDWASAAGNVDKETAQLIGNASGLLTLINSTLPAVQGLAGGMEFLAYTMGGSVLLKAVQGLLPALGTGGLQTVVAALASPAGILALGGAALIVTDQLFNWTGAVNDVIDAGLRLLTTTNESASRYGELAQATEAVTGAHGALLGGLLAAIEAEQQAAAQAAQNRAEFAEWAQLADELGGQLRFTADGLIELTFAQREADVAAKETASTFRDRLMPSLVETKISADLLKDGFILVDNTVTGTLDTFTKYSHAVSQASEEEKKKRDEAELTAEKQEELRLKTEELNLEWEKLASQERQVTLQVLGDIRVAEIQAQAEQVIAAFESIGETVKSTGELIGELAGLFVEAEGFEQTELLRLLNEENQRRQEALDLQKKLVEAQVAYLEATSERLNQGEALITIEAGGLEHDLEHLLFEILSRIQIRASEAGQNFLLGLQ